MGQHTFPRTLRYTSDDVLTFLGDVLGDYDDEVRCDAAPLTYLMPVGICCLASVCDDLHRRGQRVYFDNLAPHLDAFMERMDVFEHCHVEHDRTRVRRDHSDALLEVRRLDSEADVPDAARRLAATMTGHIMRGVRDEEDPEHMHAKPSEHLTSMLRYVLVELLENALTHARGVGYARSSVWVASTFYRKAREVRLAFVDNGCGFLNALRNHPQVRHSPSHRGAIQAALKPYVSGNPAVGILDSSSNQGIGLTISRDIAVASGGYVRITSGSASVRHGAAPERGMAHPVPWQGAVIDARLRRDDLLNVDLAKIAAAYQIGPKPKITFE